MDFAHYENARQESKTLYKMKAKRADQMNDGNTLDKMEIESRGDF